MVRRCGRDSCGPAAIWYLPDSSQWRHESALDKITGFDIFIPVFLIEDERVLIYSAEWQPPSGARLGDRMVWFGIPR